MDLTTKQLDVKAQKLNEQLLLLGGTIRQAEARLSELDIQAGRIEGGVLMLQDLRNEVVQMDEAVARKEAEDAAKALKEAEDQTDVDLIDERADEGVAQRPIPVQE